MVSVPVILTKAEMFNTFSEYVAPMFEELQANLKEARVLAIIRDALLPKLLLGEIRVGGG